jgi:ATP-dependent RNA helicase RhlE
MKPDSSVPAANFASLPLDSAIHRGIEAAGFITPRPVQAATIPSALEGRDVLGLAQTGTGKTAAFVLPILQRLIERPARGPRALVLVPTRELAMQIEAETRVLAEFTRTSVVTVFGGVPAGRQVRALRNNPDIIVACPGRLLDLMQQRVADLSRIETLVLDEADHIFDMGFLPDIRKILAALPTRRQNLMFSATMPPEIRKLADKVLVDPKVVELNNSRPAETIEHALYPVAATMKVELLEHLLSDDTFTSAIVFSRTKHRAKRLAQQLVRSGHEAVALQGNMSQSQRDRAMGGFREGRFKILVATDIAARGIDVAGVSHVINFDVPGTPEAYTHRIGRTGRAELTGKAFTLISREDAQQVRAIERRLGAPIERRQIEGFAEGAANRPRTAAGDDMSEADNRPPRGRGPRSSQNARTKTSAQQKPGQGGNRRQGDAGAAGAGAPARRRRRRVARAS